MSHASETAAPQMRLPEGLPNPERLLAFLAIAIALTMAVLDSAIINVALPVLARDLQIDAASTIWAVNAYQLAVTVSLLPLASLGDTLSYRRISWGGLALFTVASLGCGLSSSLSMLVGGRILPGVWGCRDYERQHRPCAVHLSTQPAWSWSRQYSPGGCCLVCSGPNGGSGNSVSRILALAVPGQRPSWCFGTRDRRSHTA